MKQFLKSADVSLKNGGYLMDSKENAIYNEAFVSAQAHANYIMTFAAAAKGKDFKGKKADSVDDLRREVTAVIMKTDKVDYVTAPTTVARPTTEALAKEALAFIGFTETSTRVAKVNSFMQQFNTLKEFEEFGLFFEQQVVKLKRIYTVAEILAAVNETIDLLN